MFKFKSGNQNDDRQMDLRHINLIDKLVTCNLCNNSSINNKSPLYLYKKSTITHNHHSLISIKLKVHNGTIHLSLSVQMSRTLFYSQIQLIFYL